jgi:hypothetical protein
MGKGITGLDRTQLSCLVEMVLGDTEISLAPRILGPLAAVRATLMYLRTNTSQEAIAEIMGVSQPTISRAISVVTRIIARVLGPVLATVEEVPHGGVHIIDGAPAVLELEGSDGPVVGQAQAHRPEPASAGQPRRAPAVGLRPATGGHPRHQGHHHLRSLGGDRPLLLHRR